jgi:hypothetical protein
MIMTDKRSVADRMVFSEVTHDNWRDFEGLFECRGGPKACWCMVWRAMPIEAKQTDGLTRKAAMKARIAAGTTVGLLGYLNKEPVAWCSVAPAVERGHYVLEECAEGGGAGDAFPGGLKEDGVWP